MIINVIPKGGINCGSFISRLWVKRLDVHQFKLPAIEHQTASRRIQCEEMEMMVALTDTRNHLMQFGFGAVS